ncbi:S8 family serine peptidase [Williamsoniiplasma lucivorax]|uniref:Serine protease n=1 Tax=Williamsoniiplasma lucivorax TaxID=209274 RepID=A0A2S5RF23_9MOLU|nr:S8 family serine peptidase [Williamsoniiplasma lucivorax]PPE05929.1 serine protease [Williamsoniiplasma lucivorax]
MKNEIYKLNEFKNIKSVFEKNGGGTPQYRNLKISLEHYENIINSLFNITKTFDDFANSFLELPITCDFSKLLGKGHRFKRFFKNVVKNPLKQIDSKYVFNYDNTLEDAIKITYLVDKTAIEKTITHIKIVIKFFNNNEATITKIDSILKSSSGVSEKDKEIEKILESDDVYYESRTKTIIKDILLDMMHLTKISIYQTNKELITKGDFFVRFNSILDYEKINKIFKSENIEINEDVYVSKKDLILNLDELQLEKIIQEFPFLINTATKNKITYNKDFDNEQNPNEALNNEMIKQQIENAFKNKEIPNFQIGVIDSYACIEDPWTKLIESENTPLPSNEQKDWNHGTMVSTLIAGNDAFNNKKYKDGLGFFKVKHFGILPQGTMEMSYFIKTTEEIIINNPNIKLWNLSVFDASTPLKRNLSISEMGKQLDRIQKENGVLIIIAAGNNNVVSYGSDSILALTVGSIFKDEKNNNKESHYTGKMKVFGLFSKPNSYDFGNSLQENENLNDTVWTLGESGYINYHEDGTSISAPLLTRKCAHLIKKYGFNINSLKAYVNLEHELNIKNGKTNPINCNIEDGEGVITLFYDGQIKPGKKIVEKFYLPFKNTQNGKKYRNFLVATSISYTTNTNVFVGDEYSSCDISIALISSVSVTEKGLPKIKRKNVLNPKEPKKKDKAEIDPMGQLEQINKNLVEDFKKYNPNKVLIDFKIQDKIDEYFVKTFNTIENVVDMEISCLDLFNHPEPVNFGVVIKLFEIEKDSLINFSKENVQILNIERERVKIKA